MLINLIIRYFTQTQNRDHKSSLMKGVKAQRNSHRNSTSNEASLNLMNLMALAYVIVWQETPKGKVNSQVERIVRKIKNGKAFFLKKG